jgi:hypothetical protein
MDKSAGHGNLHPGGFLLSIPINHTWNSSTESFWPLRILSLGFAAS